MADDQNQGIPAPDYSQPPDRSNAAWQGGSVQGPPPGSGQESPPPAPQDYSNPPERAKSFWEPSKDKAERHDPRGANPEDYMNPPARAGDLSSVFEGRPQQAIASSYANRDDAFPASKINAELDNHGGKDNPTAPYHALTSQQTPIDKFAFTQGLAKVADHAAAVGAVLGQGTQQHPPDYPASVNTFNEGNKYLLDGKQTVAQMAGDRIVVNQTPLGDPNKVETYVIPTTAWPNVVKAMSWDSGMQGGLTKALQTANQPAGSSQVPYIQRGGQQPPAAPPAQGQQPPAPPPGANMAQQPPLPESGLGAQPVGMYTGGADNGGMFGAGSARVPDNLQMPQGAVQDPDNPERMFTNPSPAFRKQAQDRANARPISPMQGQGGASDFHPEESGAEQWARTQGYQSYADMQAKRNPTHDPWVPVKDQARNDIMARIETIQHQLGRDTSAQWRGSTEDKILTSHDQRREEHQQQSDTGGGGGGSKEPGTLQQDSKGSGHVVPGGESHYTNPNNKHESRDVKESNRSDQRIEQGNEIKNPAERYGVTTAMQQRAQNQINKLNDLLYHIDNGTKDANGQPLVSLEKGPNGQYMYNYNRNSADGLKLHTALNTPDAPYVPSKAGGGVDHSQATGSSLEATDRGYYNKLVKDVQAGSPISPQDKAWMENYAERIRSRHPGSEPATTAPASAGGNGLPPQNQLVVGRTYPTKYGNATWDGHNFVLGQ